MIFHFDSVRFFLQSCKRRLERRAVLKRNGSRYKVCGNASKQATWLHMHVVITRREAEEEKKATFWLLIQQGREKERANLAAAARYTDIVIGCTHMHTHRHIHASN